jgi:hypothetical protein
MTWSRSTTLITKSTSPFAKKPAIPPGKPADTSPFPHLTNDLSAQGGGPYEKLLESRLGRPPWTPAFRRAQPSRHDGRRDDGRRLYGNAVYVPPGGPVGCADRLDRQTNPKTVIRRTEKTSGNSLKCCAASSKRVKLTPMLLSLGKRITRPALAFALAFLLAGFRHVCGSETQCAVQAPKAVQRTCHAQKGHCAKSSSKPGPSPCCPRSLCGIQQEGLPTSSPSLSVKIDVSPLSYPPASDTLCFIVLFTQARVFSPPGSGADPSSSPHPHNHGPPHDSV